MTLKQLEIFVAVTDERSFTRAAARLGMTQPAVSMQIRSLEELLQVQLLERGERTVHLTPAGQFLYEKAKAILGHYAQLEDALAEYRGLKRGKLRLGASTVPGEFLLPTCMGAFRKSRPDLEFQLSIANTHQVLDRLKNREIDLGVVGAAEEDPLLTFTPWLEDRLVIIAGRDWTLEGSTSLADLVRERWLFRERGSATRRFLEDRLREMRLELDPQAVTEMGSQRAVLSGVIAGLGIALLSRWAAREALELGLVREIPLRDWEGRRTLYLVRLRGKYISPFEAAFFDFLLEQSHNLVKDAKLW